MCPVQFMNLLRIVSFSMIKIRMSDFVTSFLEFFGIRNIMDRMLGDLQTGDDLSISINQDRGVQEPFSRFTGSSGIVVTRKSW